MESVKAGFKASILNRWMYPRNVQVALDQTLKATEELDRYMADRHEAELTKLLPTYQEDIVGVSREALYDVKNIADQYLTGAIPTDVQEQIEKSAAELGISNGLFGPIQSFGTAKSLGLTSLQLQQYGVELMSNAVSPMTTRLLQNTMMLMPPTTDPTALYQSAMNQLTGIASINPTSVMGEYNRVALTNSALAWDAQISSFNAQADLWTTEQMLAQQERAIQAEIDKNKSSFWGGVLDTVFDVVGTVGSAYLLASAMPGAGAGAGASGGVGWWGGGSAPFVF
jgi:hypothetical protein